MTEQFKDLLSLLIDIKFNGKQGTCNIETKVKDDLTGVETKPIISVVELSAKVTRDGLPMD